LGKRKGVNNIGIPRKTKGGENENENLKINKKGLAARCLQKYVDQ
jgi:hypothetical protein